MKKGLDMIIGHPKELLVMTMKDTIRGGHKSNFMEKRGHKTFNFKADC